MFETSGAGAKAAAWKVSRPPVRASVVAKLKFAVPCAPSVKPNVTSAASCLRGLMSNVIKSLIGVWPSVALMKSSTRWPGWPTTWAVEVPGAVAESTRTDSSAEARGDRAAKAKGSRMGRMVGISDDRARAGCGTRDAGRGSARGSVSSAGHAPAKRVRPPL